MVIKKKIKVLRMVGELRPGIYTITGNLANQLIKNGDGVEIKEEKCIYETKEEKFSTPVETKNYAETSLKKLSEIINTLTDDELLHIIKSDERKGAVKLATEEIKRRENG